MKKYWKLLAIIIVILAGIGTFYIHSAYSTNRLPTIEITDHSGNREVINSVQIEGSFTYDEFLDGEAVTINEKGSRFYSQKNFFELTTYRKEMEQLIQEHRSFMRGKTTWGGKFAENEQYLAYATIDYEMVWNREQQEKIKIDVLDKKSDSLITINPQVPSDEKRSYMGVEEVAITNDVLHVIIQSEDGDTGNEIHVFRFDIPSKKMIDDQSLLATGHEDGDTYSLITMPQSSENIGENNYTVFAKEFYRRENGEEQITEDEALRTELFVYDAKTGKLKPITLPKELQNNVLHYFDGEHLYFTTINKKQLHLNWYNLKTKQISSGDIYLNKQAEGYDNPILAVKNNRVFILSQPSDYAIRATLTVLDLQSGKTMYEGEIKLKNPTGKSDKYFLYIDNMMVY